jgi:lysophospholipase L1-like esterase
VSFARRVRSAVLYLLVTGTIFCVAGEILSRAVNLPDRVNGFPRRLYVATDDPHLPYTLRPGLTTMLRGIPVHVNEFGLRGPAVSAVPAPGVHRVLALGDSATFGERLPAEEAFPAVLERELTARSRERWEVLNAGVQGYNTEDELAFLRSRGLALRPETVVVGFNLNDFDWSPVIGPLGILSYDRNARVSRWSPANISEFYLALRWLVITRGRFLGADPTTPATFTPTPGERFLAFDRAVSAYRKQYYARPTDGRWQVLVDSLYGLADTARANHLRLVVALIPDGDQFDDTAPPFVPQTKLLAICADAGLECLDLWSAFAAVGGADLYFDIMHPNGPGQRVVAHALADQLLGAGSASLHVPERAELLHHRGIDDVVDGVAGRGRGRARRAVLGEQRLSRGAVGLRR